MKPLAEVAPVSDTLEIPVVGDQSRLIDLHKSDWRGPGGYNNALELYLGLRKY